MSHNELEQGTPVSGISDLFDRFRERQSDHPSFEQNANGDNEASESLFAADESISSTPIDEQSNSETEVSFDDSAALNSGTMPPEARRALVNLLRQGVILAGQKSNLFDSICRYQDAVRSHLADVYLKLVLDQRAGVAFIAGLDESDVEEEAVSLITRRTLSLYDTLLLLVLRKHYQERETAGEQRIIIDIERIEANLSPFLPLTNSTRSDRKKLDASLQKMVERHILSSVRGSDDRFEITPIIRYVVNAEFLESMLAEYKQLAFDAGLNTELPSNVEIEYREKNA